MLPNGVVFPFGPGVSTGGRWVTDWAAFPVAFGGAKSLRLILGELFLSGWVSLN